jgi:hypothetical protein
MVNLNRRVVVKVPGFAKGTGIKAQGAEHRAWVLKTRELYKQVMTKVKSSLF